MSLLSRKVWWAAQIGSFWPKVDVFYRSKWIMEGGDKNEFWVFSNAEMNLPNNCSGKSRWKKWGYLPSFFPELESLNCLKKPIFCILRWPQQEILYVKSVCRFIYSVCKVIYVNFFKKISFLAKVSTKLQKMHFLGQFKDHNLGRKHGKWPHFVHLLFPF